MEHMLTFPFQLVTFPGYVLLPSGDVSGIPLALFNHTRVGIYKIHKQWSGDQAQQDQAPLNALFVIIHNHRLQCVVSLHPIRIIMEFHWTIAVASNQSLVSQHLPRNSEAFIATNTISLSDKASLMSLESRQNQLLADILFLS